MADEEPAVVTLERQAAALQDLVEKLEGKTAVLRAQLSEARRLGAEKDQALRQHIDKIDELNAEVQHQRNRASSASEQLNRYMIAVVNVEGVLADFSRGMRVAARQTGKTVAHDLWNKVNTAVKLPD